MPVWAAVVRWDIVMAEPGGQAPMAEPGRQTPEAREWHCAVGLLDCVVVVTACPAQLLLPAKFP